MSERRWAMDYESFQEEQSERPVHTFAPSPFKAVPTHKQFLEAARTRSIEEGPTGLAAVLIVIGILGVIAGALVFASANNSIHEIASFLVLLGGLIAFCAGALMTELQRIRRAIVLGLPPVED